jgi:hypothetical protein
MPFDHNILIKAGAIPAFINMLNNFSGNPGAILKPLTMLAGLTKDPSNEKSMYDNNDSELTKAVFKVIAANSNNIEILTKCIRIILNMDIKIALSDATNAILFCEAVSFLKVNENNVESTTNQQNHDSDDDPNDIPDCK